MAAERGEVARRDSLSLFQSSPWLATRCAQGLLGGGAVLAVTAILWAPTLAYPRVYEDLNQPGVQWRGVRTEVRDFQVLHPARFASNLSYRLTHAVSQNPWADHLGSVLVHLMNTALVMAVAWPVFGMLPALLAGTLFGTLRLQTEAVAYISSRPDLLVATGILVALLAVSWKRYWLLPLGLVIAALSKETGIMAAPLALFWAWRVDRPIPMHWLAGLGVLAAVFAFGHWAEFASVWLGSTREMSDHLAMLGRLLLLVWPIGTFTIDHDWTWITPLVSALSFVAMWIVIHEYSARPNSWLGFALVFPLIALLPRLLLHDSEGLHEHHLAASCAGIALAAGGRMAQWQ